MEHSELPVAGFAFPGPLRDQLVGAILAGAKTTTAGRLVEYEHDGDPLPRAGDRLVVVDSAERAVAVIEVVDVRVVPVREVDDAHAADEGEGYTTAAEWRRVHEEFWQSPEMAAHLGDAQVPVDDDTLVVLQRFQVVERIPG